MKEEHEPFETLPFPKTRQPVVDSLMQARRMNPIHLLLELDVTDTRKAIRQYRKTTGEPLSLTAFLTYCLARAVDEHKLVQAYRRRGTLVVAHDVDVSVIIERDTADGKAPIFPHVIKAANGKSLDDIDREIRAAQADHAELARTTTWLERYYYLPGFVRGLLWRVLLGSPTWRMRLTGTVGLSAAGMFGKGAGWGIPFPTYTLNVTVGGITQKPGVADGQIAIREFLCVTISFDHNVVDGAPAARFAGAFREMVERGHGLKQWVGG